MRPHGSYQPQAGEGGKLARTYRLDPAVVELLDACCERYGYWQSGLLQALIIDGLARLERGELRLVKQPTRFVIRIAD